LHDLDAFVWICVVTNDVAQADEVRAVALMRISQDGFRCLEIGVKIAENCETPEWRRWLG
jgi:hypothetical protein